MHPADGVILAIIAISILFGVFRGLVREAFSLAGWVAAYVVARNFSAPFEHFLEAYIDTPSLRLLAAWGGLFVVTLLLSLISLATVVLFAHDGGIVKQARQRGQAASADTDPNEQPDPAKWETEVAIRLPDDAP